MLKCIITLYEESQRAISDSPVEKRITWNYIKTTLAHVLEKVKETKFVVRHHLVKSCSSHKEEKSSLLSWINVIFGASEDYLLGNLSRHCWLQSVVDLEEIVVSVYHAAILCFLFYLMMVCIL